MQNNKPFAEGKLLRKKSISESEYKVIILSKRKINNTNHKKGKYSKMPALYRKCSA